MGSISGILRFKSENLPPLFNTSFAIFNILVRSETKVSRLLHLLTPTKMNIKTAAMIAVKTAFFLLIMNCLLNNDKVSRHKKRKREENYEKSSLHNNAVSGQ